MEDLDQLFDEALARVSVREPLTEGTKLCAGCNCVKSVEEFNNRFERGKGDKYGKVSRCKTCTQAKAKAWYYGDHEKAKKLGRLYQYKRRHGERLTDAEAAQLADSNLGYCDLCADYGTVMVDHDHRTEARRGFLCSRCNFALGGFQDSAELLEKAAQYLRYYREQT